MEIGTRIYVQGLDGQCLPCIQTSIFIGNHADGRAIVKGDDGIKVLLDHRTLYTNQNDLELIRMHRKNMISMIERAAR